jgi:hypothetical protein
MNCCRTVGNRPHKLTDLMRVLHNIALVLLGCSAIASADPTISAAIDPTTPCLSYDDPAVTLSGTVFSRIYFGPPGYGETPAQDARERATLLLLDAPACVKSSSHPEQDNNSYEGNVIVVQLAAVHVKPELLVAIERHRAMVRGSLFHALTGHHRTPVVMDVYSAQREDSNAR